MGNNGLKLFHAQVDGFTGSSDHFVVAENEDKARDIVYEMYGGKGGGQKKSSLYVCEVEVDGYTIQISENQTK